MTLLEITQILEEMRQVPGFEPGLAYIAPLETIRAAYNGCGPERWPAEWRDRLDALTAIYAPAVLVHDLDFGESDGTESGLTAANARFHRNLKAIFRHHYPLFSLRILSYSYRLERARAKAIMLTLIVCTTAPLTRRAWREAFERRLDVCSRC